MESQNKKLMAHCFLHRLWRLITREEPSLKNKWAAPVPGWKHTESISIHLHFRLAWEAQDSSCFAIDHLQDGWSVWVYDQYWDFTRLMDG